MPPELQQLKDIHLPAVVNHWLIAPGWIFLYLMIMFVFCYASYLWIQRKKRRYLVKYALHQLNQLKLLLEYNPDNVNIAAEISTLIRRTALHYFNREKIAGLFGQEWLRFLNHSGHTTQFTTIGQSLIDAPYCKHNTTDLLPLFLLTKNWLFAIAKTKTKK